MVGAELSIYLENILELSYNFQVVYNVLNYNLFCHYLCGSFNDKNIALGATSAMACPSRMCLLRYYKEQP